MERYGGDWAVAVWLLNAVKGSLSFSHQMRKAGSSEPSCVGGGGNSPGRANIGSGLPDSRAAKEAQLASSDTVPKQNKNKKKQAKPAESAVLHMGNVMLGSCN